MKTTQETDSGIGSVPAFIPERTAAIRSQCERYGVRELAIFGSSLRADFDPLTSDVDLAVVFGPPSNETLVAQYFDFKEPLEPLLGRSAFSTRMTSPNSSRMCLANTYTLDQYFGFNLGSEFSPRRGQLSGELGK
jgi:predicted nucleotidyltransferase